MCQVPRRPLVVLCVAELVASEEADDKLERGLKSLEAKVDQLTAKESKARRMRERDWNQMKGAEGLANTVPCHTPSHPNLAILDSLNLTIFEFPSRSFTTFGGKK